nr:restriction endonuclease subunit S [Caballeronia sp. GACF4]
MHKDGNHGSNYPRVDDFGVSGTPFLSAKSIRDDGTIDESLIERLRQDKADRLKIGWIDAGDVLLAHNASVGKVALYNGTFGKALIGTSLTAFRPNQAVLTSHFLSFSLTSALFQKQLKQNMAQTTRNQVPITVQRELTIRVPPIKKQLEFSRLAEIIAEQKRKQNQSMAALFLLFRSLQHRAFTGSL